jgi:hypothetical protein
MKIPIKLLASLTIALIAQPFTASQAAIPPIIGEAPASQTVLAGADVILTAHAEGTEPLTYSWYLNGLPISGATAATLSLTNVSPTQSGTYAVKVSNSAGSATARARIQVDSPNPSVLPLALTGWNADVIVEPKHGPVPTWWFDAGGWQWIAAELSASGEVHPDGFPTSGRFTSALNTNVAFQLQPFAGNNVLLLSSPVDPGIPGYIAPPDHTTDELTLVQPARYSFLAVAAASGGYGGIGTIVLNFADGTHSREFPLMGPDWWNGGHSDYWTDPEAPGAPAIAGLGRVSSGFNYDNSLGYGFNLYESDIDLAAEGLDNKPLASVTFSKPPATLRKVGIGPLTTGIFAVSGALNAPRFTGMINPTAAGFQFSLKAPLGAVLHVESSDDLVSWKHCLTATNSGGILQATDSQPTPSSSRFYRAIQVLQGP